VVENFFVFGWFCVLGKVFPQCEHLRKPGAFVHKAVKTAFLSSQPISYVVLRPKAQAPMAQGISPNELGLFLIPPSLSYFAKASDFAKASADKSQDRSYGGFH